MKKSIMESLLIVVAFIAGRYWPYFLPPSDFGTYSSDRMYKYVLLQDETRLCRIVTILDNNSHVVFHTSGYMDYGWHNGRYKTIVEWAKHNNDLFVGDSRGTFDVYIFKDSTWNGPYSIRKLMDKGTPEYWITARELIWNPNEFKGLEEAVRSDSVNAQYDYNNIPDEFLW